jgi:hypothetical protein
MLESYIKNISFEKSKNESEERYRLNDKFKVAYLR